MLRILILFTAAVVFCIGVPTRTQATKSAANIVRPCELHDLKCIRDNLSVNSKCNRNVLGSIPGAYTITNFRFETPYFNATYIDNVAMIRNQDECYVSEFFFNIKGDSAVLSIDCPYLGIASNRTVIQHRSLHEDSMYSYLIDGIYPLIRLTTNFKHADKMDLCSAYTLADVVALPMYKINPNNLKTANYLSRDLSDLKTYERETFCYRAPQLYRKYVNSVICNFGCF